ncbi:hypothetical protein M5689_006903 [Euphorbia peplus]|nr:hypothetical protein M5689_006903 [Euphorbia peplus]
MNYKYKALVATPQIIVQASSLCKITVKRAFCFTESNSRAFVWSKSIWPKEPYRQHPLFILRLLLFMLRDAFSFTSSRHYTQ